MRPSNTKLILTACRMSFDGQSDDEIKDILEVSKTSLTRWRKTETWQEFEAELIEAYKQSVLSSIEAHRSQKPVTLTG